jgi:hypothetical protein
MYRPRGRYREFGAEQHAEALVAHEVRRWCSLGAQSTRTDLCDTTDERGSSGFNCGQANFMKFYEIFQLRNLTKIKIVIFFNNLNLNFFRKLFLLASFKKYYESRARFQVADRCAVVGSCTGALRQCDSACLRTTCACHCLQHGHESKLDVSVALRDTHVSRFIAVPKRFCNLSRLVTIASIMSSDCYFMQAIIARCSTRPTTQRSRSTAVPRQNVC